MGSIIREPTTGRAPPPEPEPERAAEPDTRGRRGRRRRRQVGAQGRGSLILAGQLGGARIGTKTLTGQ